jgi:hypothetical protein
VVPIVVGGGAAAAAGGRSAVRFGAALRDCWRQWCRVQLPASPAPSEPELLASS